MTVKNNYKNRQFCEKDVVFIKTLAKAIGCYYSKANERTYNLNKYNSEVHSEMGVFAWVHKDEADCFWISTRKIWVEAAKAKLISERKATGANCFPKDTNRAEDSVNLDTRERYDDTVNVLKLIKKTINVGNKHN